MRRMLSLAAALALCAACASLPPASGSLPPGQEAFWAALRQHCGRAYEGRLAEGNASDTAFAGKTLVMHVRRCTADSVLVPFHVGEDRSRTWVLTRTAAGLRLKHDHRHEDGSEDRVTQYGGDTRDAGSATRQEFPADAFTASLIPAAAANVWTVEVVPGERFAYALRREGTDRRFRVEFDLTRPVAPPPAPWGH
ncbi:MAG TPA: hypothetical protein VHG51_03365 [Longimicrobiaceae bacterium]|nr:hypothetical protein [Longimicrobiaceae bacterium]